MRSIATLCAGVALTLALTSSLWADCCSMPVVGGQGLTEAKIIELIKQFGNPGTTTPPTTTTTPPTTPPVEQPNENGGNQAPGGNQNQPDANAGNTFPVQQIAGVASFGEEPSQRAVIAWNRLTKKEIMSLEVTYKSKVGKGTMLTFLPLPGMVDYIKQGDKDLYTKAAGLVLKKQAAGAFAGVSPVVYQTKFGAHNIFVWRVDNKDQFFRRVQRFVNKTYKGQAMALFTKKVEKTVQNYFNRGIRYFAFDLIETSKVVGKREAVEFKFHSDSLYYPVDVTAGGATGNTRIELCAFTDEKGLNRFGGGIMYKKGPGSLLPDGKSVFITHNEMRGIHGGIANLFSNQQQIVGRLWVIDGDVQKITGDVKASYVSTK